MHPYLLSVSVLCVAPVLSAQGAVCTTLPQVEEHLLAAARNLEPELHLRVDPALQPALQKYLFCITSQFCFKFRMRPMPDGEIILTPQYADDWRIIQSLTRPQAGIRLTEREEKTLAEARRRVAALVKPGMSRSAVVKALHDDLVSRMTYKPSRWMGGASAALLENEGVCEAYARALGLMLHLADIPSRKVFGMLDKRTTHEWNLVFINGRRLHVDATLSDTRPASGPFLLLPDSALSRTHSWCPSLLPAAEKEL